MIDTVCLLIPKDKMSFPSGVSSWELYSQTDQFDRYVRNPNKEEKETGKYFPKLTGFKKGFFKDASVRIEFSVPKLVYLNNLDEVEDKDFIEVVDTLQERLKVMGVSVKKEILENASVSSIHFSRNIQLEEGYTSNRIISELNKVNLRKSFDITRSKYTNDGECLYAHSTSHQFIIYDKVADMNKGKKRAIDKDQTIYQHILYAKLNKKESHREIIRFEVRISQKRKLNKLLEGLGYQKNPVFKQIFNAQISTKIVSNYWRTLILDCSFGIFSKALSIKDLLQILFTVDKTIKPKRAIYLVGLCGLMRDETGIRQLRTILSKVSDNRTWYRTVKEDMSIVSKLINESKPVSWVHQINKKLIDYKPYKIKNYEEK